MSTVDVVAIGRIILGESAAIKRLKDEIASLAARPLRSLLVVGETGAGKELVPEALRACVPGRWSHIEVFNCPAVPLDHLESELFGTARGAYPGAVDRPGALERAAGGLLFLDEIVAMAPHHQPKILRMLESGEGRRLGAPRRYRVSAPIVAATREDPVACVKCGDLREDLYYRLVQDGVLRVPPLRERPEDVPTLAAAFLGDVPGAAIHPDALSILVEHRWPGNVRELRAVVRAASRFAVGGPLGAYAVKRALAGLSASKRSLPESRGPASAPLPFRRLPPSVQRRYLRQALKAADGNQTEAGIHLGFHVAGQGNRAASDPRARKLAHRKFRYWWRKTHSEGEGSDTGARSFLLH